MEDFRTSSNAASEDIAVDWYTPEAREVLYGMKKSPHETRKRQEEDRARMRAYVTDPKRILERYEK